MLQANHRIGRIIASSFRARFGGRWEAFVGARVDGALAGRPEDFLHLRVDQTDVMLWRV